MIQRYRRRLSFQKIPTAIYFAAISWLQLSLTVFSTAASGLRNTNEMSMHTCGFWQGPYAALDKAIKAGQRYPRFTVVEYTATGSASQDLHLKSSVNERLIAEHTKLMCIILSTRY